MAKGPFNFDEREMNTFLKICTTMYIITLMSLMVIQLYRQFVLNQPQEAWNDIAMLMAINILVLFGAILYLTGAINPKNMKFRYILAGYAGFVLIGFLFTVFKYTVLLEQELTSTQLLDYLLIVIKISGVLLLAWGLLAYLGSRRIEKKIE